MQIIVIIATVFYAAICRAMPCRMKQMKLTRTVIQDNNVSIQ